MKLSSSVLVLLAVTTTLVISPCVSLFCGNDNCYELLGVSRNSTKSEIRRAWRQISTTAHPDKHPNDAKALERFRKMGAAYEALTDDGKRAKYEDFLENPAKYWDYLVQHSKEVYAPKSNTIFVIIFLIGIINGLHWLNMKYTYATTLQKMKDSVDFKRQVKKLLKSKKASTEEEAESMIQLDVVGLEEPDWKNLIIFRMINIPKAFCNLLIWKVKWFVNYRVRKLDYSEHDQLYLIEKNMGFTDDDMINLSDSDRKLYIEKELWDKEKCVEFMRLKRIELNRLGKGKKKRKHTSIPYSETEEVSLSE